MAFPKGYSYSLDKEFGPGGHCEPGAAATENFERRFLRRFCGKPAAAVLDSAAAPPMPALPQGLDSEVSPWPEGSLEPPTSRFMLAHLNPATAAGQNENNTPTALN